MSIEIATREVNGVVILDVSGSLWPRTDRGGPVLSEFVEGLLGNDKKKILLNLRNVKAHDNSGLGELVASFKAARKRGAQLKLLNVTQTLYARMTLARLNKIFDIYSDEASAILAFAESLAKKPASPTDE